MADYYSPTIIEPTIPNVDMTPLEQLLLSNIFEAEQDGEGWYFFAEEGPTDMISVSRAELETALAASHTIDSSANAYIAEHLVKIPAAESEVDLDLGGTPWEFLFQDIVRRSTTLRYVIAIMSFTCSKMRPDGFGGAATLITADKVKGKSTHDIIEAFLNEEGLTPE